MSVEAESAGAKPPRHRFAVLDGMRALAAIMVVADHVASPTMRAWLPHRELAVDFFFVLSGFVVMHAYGERLIGANRIGPLAFMRLRILRFWPMLLAAFVLAVAAVYWREPNDHTALQWFASITLGLAFLPTPPPLTLHEWTPFPLVGPAYTLFLELFANLVLALAITRLTPRLLTVIVIITGLTFAVFGLHHGSVTVGWHMGDFWAGFIRVLFSFFAGVAVYRVWRSRAVPALPVWAAFALLLIAHITPALGPWFGPYEVVVAIVVFPLLVLFAAGSKAHGAVEQIFLRLGGLSYGFYLLHAPLNDLIELTLYSNGLDPEHFDVALYLFVIVAALALTAVVERFYEIPFRRWLGARFKRPAPAPAAPAD